MDDTPRPRPTDAQQALDSVSALEDAGRARAAPSRWFGAGVALLIACLFALYALDDPYPYVVFPIVGLGLFITAMRENAGAYGREFPVTKAHLLALISVILAAVLVLVGTVYLRRVFDAAWVPIAVGVAVGLVLFLANESARRSMLARRGTGTAR